MVSGPKAETCDHFNLESSCSFKTGFHIMLLLGKVGLQAQVIVSQVVID